MTSYPPFVFLGTPEIARDTLELLAQENIFPAFIITGPDRPVGRHFTMTSPPVKIFAEEHAIPFFQPERLDASTQEHLVDMMTQTLGSIPPLFLVVAYGKILPESFIALPTQGTYNIHYSLLPRWRGASPVEAALLHGDTTTGVGIQRMVYALDAGNIIAEETIPLESHDTTSSVRKKLIPLGAALFRDKVLAALGAGTLGEGTVQHHEQATRCGKIKKEDGYVNLDQDTPESIWNKYRAYDVWPGIFFRDGEGKRVKITQASYNDHRIIIEKVIPEGKKEMSWETYLQ